MPPNTEGDDDTGALERAKERLYKVGGPVPLDLSPKPITEEHVLPHQWQEDPLPQYVPQKKKHIRYAGVFFGIAFLFFLISLGVAGYFFYFGGYSVSTSKIEMDIKGPTTIAGGDIVPLVLTITNKNPVAIDNATVQVDFPNGTRDASDVTKDYPRYTEDLGQMASGATVTRSLKAVVFGAAGQTLVIPVSFSYGMSGSSSTYKKKESYSLAISSTPVEVSVGAPTESVSGKPLTFTLTVRSNTTVPLRNVVLVGTFPFGFTPTDSSLALSNDSFLIGTLAPGETKNMTLTGTLSGQEGEQRVFHFSVGTASSANNQTLAVTYMAQDATVSLTAPFISATIAVNGDTSSNIIVPAGSRQNVTVSYANTLSSSVSNVNVAIKVSGSAVDYGSIETTRGFYRSSDHTIVFSQDTDPALANLAPGASGIGTFTFSTLSAGALTASPSITFTTSISGTRTGQSDVPDEVNASATKTIKVASAAALSAYALQSSGSIANSGPVPPVANQTTTYSVVWNIRTSGSSVADGVVTATLPSYVTYTGKTSGTGAFKYDPTSRKVTWSVGELAQGGSSQGVFQVSFLPSSSQKGSAPKLTGVATFVGHDRGAGVPVNATAEAAITETKNDAGYSLGNGTVQ